MNVETAPRIFRNDYKVPDYLAKTITLDFVIGDDKTHVKSVTHYVRNPASSNVPTPLRLMGADLKLLNVAIDGNNLSEKDYAVEGEILTVHNVPNDFMLLVETEIDPAHNTALEGLYASGTMFCTQCEAEGFRHITYYPDRPDVMAVFTTRIEADKKKYPVLLSNGNCIKEEDLGARHRVTWHDPFPKPCYLFALVAGDLVKITDQHITTSGRKVLLEIYCEHGKQDQLGFAMQSLKNSMAWDEKRFGREYDLDRFMIVAASFFNAGAMENKGLNIFNSAMLLGKPETATDRDLANIEAVVGHEYFHNWSGDRVTCRDWFQLSLKEGFTVFRDQEFSRDMNSPVTERIDHIRLLRNIQFPEDASPMAHPIRPDSYITIDNFYTTTVYEKGAEVVRMLQTIFGIEGFRAGSDLYFDRFDGQAVTCDDFVQAIFDANKESKADVTLEQFKHWYTQSGTPRVSVSSYYDEAKKQYHLIFRQTLANPAYLPMVIPVNTGLIDKTGKDIPGTVKTLILNQPEQTFVFDNIAEKPVPSLLRHFSAPVILDYPYTDAELAFLARHDSDLVNRWDALQKLAQKELLAMIAARQTGNYAAASPVLLEAFGAVLDQADNDPDFAATSLVLPGETELGQTMLRMGQKIDIDAIHGAREALRLNMAVALRPKLQALYNARKNIDAMATDGRAMGDRRLKAATISLLTLLAEPGLDALAYEQFTQSQNMTEAMSALAALNARPVPLREKALAAFYEKWSHEDLIVDKWFALQGGADRADVLDEVKRLMEHPAFVFTNPNKIYALIGSFTANLVHFHKHDGSGYAFLADVILKLDKVNPQIAGRRVNPLTRWRDYDEVRAGHMQKQLQRIAAAPGVSKNTLEVALAGLKTDTAS